MRNLLDTLLFHRGNSWWNLPESPHEEPARQHEGPLGDGGRLLQRWWNTISRAGHTHGTPAFYTLIGVVLGIITLIEVWLFGVEGLGAWLVPLLLLLSLGKFILVVAFFMHLRFDKKYYSWVFTACFLLGVSLFIAIWLLVNFAGQTV